MKLTDCILEIFTMPCTKRHLSVCKLKIDTIFRSKPISFPKCSKGLNFYLFNKIILFRRFVKSYFKGVCTLKLIYQR